MPARLRCLSLLLVLSSAGTLASAAEPADPAADAKVSYYKQIRPIFQAHCQGCHQPAKQGGEYVMTEHAGLLQGGESGEKGIVPGHADQSNLIAQITPVDGKAEMPKGKPPLAASEIELVGRWINEGAADDTPPGAVQKHDAEHPPTYVLPPVLTALAYSPDGQLLAVSGYHEVLLHKVDGSELVARLVGLSERIESIVFSPDGKRLAVTGGQPGRMGEVQIWDVEKRALQISVPVTYDTIYGASWSPDGKFVAFGCADNSVRAIEAETGKQIFFNAASSDWVLDTAFSVDGKHLVSVGRDQTVKLFVFDTERFVDNVTSITPGALTGGIPVVDRHPTKDEILVGGSDGVPKTYLMHRTKKRVIGDDHQKIRHFPGLPGRVFTACYSPDGNRVAAGSSSNGKGELRVFENADGKEAWKVETQALYAIAFSPDGQTIAAAGFDGKISRFQAADGKPLGEFIPVPLSEPVAATDQAAQTAEPEAAKP